MNKLEENYRYELVQVAAVAVAAIQNFDTGDSSLFNISSIFDEILKERKHQITKFGINNRHPFAWNTILGEEYGEVCEASLLMEFGADEQGFSLFSEKIS